ncbi:MAG TPA: cobalamin-binding protein [Oxalicibacterium sp.]|jgi:iron complex transport system substrate-binding protein|nr:cobalamin-binding protein [Oxalicibacterium sp.]
MTRCDLVRLLFRPLLCFAICLPPYAEAAITVQDDTGRMVRLEKPAERIVSLAPNTTELLFAAGAGGRIVGTVDYSDYPQAARKIPRIGSFEQIDVERLIALKPDLVVLWADGGMERQLGTVRRLGIPVFYSSAHKLADIPDSIERLGRLTATVPQAEQAAAGLREKLAEMRTRYRDRPPVTVFYQVWSKPLYTLNGTHILSDVLHLCGGRNVFAGLTAAAPVVSIESVLLADPEAMIAGAEPGHIGGLDMWKRYPQLRAVRQGNLFEMNSDLLSRAGPRLFDGAAAVCERLDQARQRRVGR